MRNIGGSIGTSLVATLLARRAQFHQVHLVTRLSADNPFFEDRVQVVAHRLAAAGLDTHAAHRQALARLYHGVRQQAQTLAYIDTFWLLLVLAVVMFALSFLLAHNEPGEHGEAAVG
jgi:DHA2 family multidrug resistance protein